MKKLIILDRDGVINFESKDFIKNEDEFIPIPGSLEAIAKLNYAGFSIVVATNQSGIGRGLFCSQTLQAIHNKLNKLLAKKGGAIDKFFYCPHHPDDNCYCRKPQPGLLLKIQTYYQISLTNVPFVGDSIKDIMAAQNACCQGVLVKTGNGKKTLKEHKDKIFDIPVFENLANFTRHYLK